MRTRVLNGGVLYEVVQGGVVVSAAFIRYGKGSGFRRLDAALEQERVEAIYRKGRWC